MGSLGWLHYNTNTYKQLAIPCEFNWTKFRFLLTLCKEKRKKKSCMVFFLLNLSFTSIERAIKYSHEVLIKYLHAIQSNVFIILPQPSNTDSYETKINKQTKKANFEMMSGVNKRGKEYSSKLQKGSKCKEAIKASESQNLLSILQNHRIV